MMMPILKEVEMQTSVPQREVSARMSNGERLIHRVCLAMVLLVTITVAAQSVYAADSGQTKFRRISTQYIAALGDPSATSGNGAQLWGLWPLDPGPRGVKLNRFQSLKEAGGVAPSRWKFDEADWWLEEHG
ncbi:MAG TPA: hypothetical protein DDY39_06425, partial [Nitrospira sp.]|nr:hypothetical protein [Nitrospira sp.]